MFLRHDTGLTLDSVREQVDLGDRSTSVRVKPADVRFNLDSEDPAISFGRKELPASEDNLAVVGDLLQVPSAFLKRMVKNTQASTQNQMLGEMFANMVTDDVAVEVVDNTLVEIAPWVSHQKSIRPVQVVEAVASALAEAPVSPKVARLINTRGQFAFDAYADVEANPRGKKADWGKGGDKSVGDLTSAGVRVGIDLKHNLAPTVQPFSYRLICTNGMETPMLGTQIDARGQSVEEVLAELEQMARIAFEQAERDIEHFYDLRNQRVDNPERVIRALSRERNIPTRSTMALIDLAAGEDMPDDPTMFDVLNLVTNFANSPQIRNDGGRLLLESAAGAVVTDHAARCGHCSQRVVSV